MHRETAKRTLYLQLILLLPLSLLALCIGTEPSSISDALQALLGKANNTEQLIIRDIRLPRLLLALLVGAMLASCGTACQGLFRNPLADPSLIGVSAGASMGASLCIVFAAAVFDIPVSFLLIAISAFLGGALASFLVYRLSLGDYGTSVAMMLLAGIAVSALAGAISSFSEFYSDNEQLRRISIWQMGNLSGSSSMQRWGMFALLGIVLVLLQVNAKKLNALLLGESEARHLGVNVDGLKLLVVFLVAAGLGLSVALAGIISFIGLVVPHIMRLLVGPDHRFLIINSALGGALLLLLADTLARTIVLPTELPVGVLTALLGAPFFLVLLRNKRQKIL
ncbi:iron ABC transporter permease [uncultured Pseudoteredinibacter sp.]|uniref:FecCD family ABC transporter permease n=1 Tax=uncultured Pseudoteredinibacter sp. TaxID=1641701 RepID=UPI00261C5CF0|nr:iron ABC transporter permease [uncultured Pseudoteredinibacter sp.]